MDLVLDYLANGWHIKCLKVADDYIHGCVGVAMDCGNSGLYVTRLLDYAVKFRGDPAAVRTSNGLEFTNRTYIARAGRIASGTS